jgi:hypothetical protein
MYEINDLTGEKAIETVDEGLRQYMIKIFNYMGLGLCVTAFAAWLVANTPLLAMMYNIHDNTASFSAIGWIITFAPLAMIFGFNAMMSRASVAKLRLMFFAFSFVMGMSCSNILLLYSGESITRVFLITAATFGAMSLYGYSTKRDLTAMGSFMHMGLWGVIIASIVNIFMTSSGLSYAISYISVAVFVGLTAYDVQNLKSLYYGVANDEESRNRIAVSGALSLYLDFINLFLSLLRLMGDRR